MESCFYESIQETRLLHVRFDKVLSPASVFPAHWHEYVEILFLKEGSLNGIVQASEYQLHPGDLMVINSKDLHMTRTNGCSYLLLQISASQLRSYLPDFDFLRFDTCIPKGSVSEPLCNLLSQMEQIKEEQFPQYQLLFTSKLYEFLYVLCTRCSTRLTPQKPVKIGRDLQRVTQIMEWIRLHYREPLTLEAAADSLALSKEYFCRLFKKYTGQTFLEYLNDVRTMHLYEDLLHSDKTITDLMEKHGLSNYKIFMRTFKKLYGSTPQNIRKQQNT